MAAIMSQALDNLRCPGCETPQLFSERRCAKNDSARLASIIKPQYIKYTLAIRPVRPLPAFERREIHSDDDDVAHE